MRIESSQEKISKKDLSLKLEPISSHLLRATVKIPSNLASTIHSQTVELYQQSAFLPGFKKTETPQQYIEENYKNEIELTLKGLLFKHLVLDFLMDQIIHKKIPLTNYPRLDNIHTTPNKEINFLFNLSISDPLELKEWKNFVFRAPKRKKYKDLDKQVTLFLKRETSSFKKQQPDTIQENDWVRFETILLDKQQKPILEQCKKNYWLKVNNKYLTEPFQSLLLNKKIDDTFITNNLPLKNDLSDEAEHNKYLFLIKIKGIAKGNHLSLETFKSNFKLKSKLDIHKKLIEIFSYRNDISQRKSIIEELFHLLLSKHRFEVPKHFIIRRQEDILQTLRQHPDYQVYKQQKDFFNQIELLSEKQLKEEIIVDQIAYKENIKVEEQDIENYLSLFNNNRLKEFVYFKPLLEKIEDNDTPLQNGLLKQAILREKTLNYILHTLTK
jgi:FKBP-type peptidyl-prolyl cis-trans isomerase (trigger factor)